MQSFIQRRRITRDVARQHEPTNKSIIDDNGCPKEGQEGLVRQESPPGQPAGSEHQDQRRHGSCILVVASDDDPINPCNWTLLLRGKNIAVLALLIFTQAWAGGAESMANSQISHEFGVSQTAENLSTAMYLFGIGSGSLLAGPISETLGRNPTYLIPTAFYLCFVVGTALTPTFGGQVACRYLVGLSASATLSINGASVRDQFRPVKRSFVFPVIAWANVTGKTYGFPPSTSRRHGLSLLQLRSLRPSLVAGSCPIPVYPGDGWNG